MSDRVHRTVRPTLPEGYQYGDAKKRTLAEMMAMDVDDFLAVYGIEGLARISPRTAWQQFGYLNRKAYFDDRIAGMSRSYDIDATWPPHAQRTGDETL